MELLFVVLIAAGIGAIPRYILPHRYTYGSALLPAVGAAVASVVWSALSWLGWPFDGGWIWWASLGAGGLVALFLPLLIAPPRRRHDEALFAKLLHP